MWGRYCENLNTEGVGHNGHLAHHQYHTNILAKGFWHQSKFSLSDLKTYCQRFLSSIDRLNYLMCGPVFKLPNQ